jgi:hypothetical protein
VTSGAILGGHRARVHTTCVRLRHGQRIEGAILPQHIPECRLGGDACSLPRGMHRVSWGPVGGAAIRYSWNLPFSALRRAFKLPRPTMTRQMHHDPQVLNGGKRASPSG